jgi:hypothetical protein
MKEMMNKIKDKIKEDMNANRKAKREDLKDMTEGMLRDKQNPWLTEKQDGRKETTACQEATERTELDPGMMQSIGEHQEVPKEEAIVMPVRGLRKWRRDWNPAAGCHKKPRGRIHASLVSWKRLTVAGMKVTRCARVVWHKRNIPRKDYTRANVVQEIRRGRTFRRRRQPKTECSQSIRRDVEEPLYLRKKTATTIGIRGWSSRQLSPLGRGGLTYETLNRTLELKFIKRVNWTSSGLHK